MNDVLLQVRRTSTAGRHPSRYHPILVALHWISAVGVGLAVATGKLWLEPMPNAPSDKLVLLGVHMALGSAILALTIARLFVRFSTPRPKRPTTGSRLLDAMAAVTHYSLYAALLLMAGTGLATALMAGYPAIVFGDRAGPLPRHLRAPAATGAWRGGLGDPAAGRPARRWRALSSRRSKRRADAPHVV